MDTRTLDRLASIHGSLADQLPSYEYIDPIEREAKLNRLDALAVAHLPDRMLVTYRGYLRERLGTQWQIGELMGLCQPSVRHHIKVIPRILRYFLELPSIPPLATCVAALGPLMPFKLMVESTWWWCHLRSTVQIGKLYQCGQWYAFVTVNHRVEQALEGLTGEPGEVGEIAGSLLGLVDYRQRAWGARPPSRVPMSLGVIAEKV